MNNGAYGLCLAVFYVELQGLALRQGCLHAVCQAGIELGAFHQGAVNEVGSYTDALVPAAGDVADAGLNAERGNIALHGADVQGLALADFYGVVSGS